MNPPGPERDASDRLPRSLPAQAPAATDRRYRSEGGGRALTPLVGRRSELALLSERLAQARAGRGQIVLLAGEPGVGKSRLLLEFERSVGASEVCWLASRAVSHGNQMAYLPIIELLKGLLQFEGLNDVSAIGARLEQAALALEERIQPLLPWLGHLLCSVATEAAVERIDAQERRVKTFEAFRSVLLARARRSPMILVIEDLHWIDRTSEDLLVSLADSLARAPVLVLLSCRPEYRNPFPERSFICRLPLQHLNEEETLALANRVLPGTSLPEEFRQEVLAKAEGNPFFVEEMIRSLQEMQARGVSAGTANRKDEFARAERVQIPSSIHELIMHRIERLEDAPRRALQIASVIGREFGVALLETIAGQNGSLSESLRKLKDLELIYEQTVFPEPGWCFKHALTQEVAYQSFDQEQRKELHRLLAAALEQGASDAYGLLAYHYERGEEWERALDFLQRAASKASEVGAYREEGEQLSRAIAIAERLHRTGLINELRGRRGAAWVKAGKWEEARPDLEAAIAELPAEDAGRRAELLSSLAGACFWRLDTAGTRRCAEEGRALAEKAGRVDLEAGLLGWLAASETTNGNLASATRLFEQALERGGGHCNVALANFTLVLYLNGRIPKAVERGRESVQVLRMMGDSFATTFGHPHLGLALAAGGHYSEAARAFEEARELAIKHELGSFLARAIAMSAGFHLDVFDLQGNERLALEALEVARSANFLPSVVSADLDLVFNYARQGELAKAEGLSQETAALAAEIGGWHQWLWDLRLRQARAEIACACADWPEALRLAREATRSSQERGRPKYVVAGRETAARALAALGRKSEAIEELRAALELARPMGDPALLLRAGTTLLAIEGTDALLSETLDTAKRIMEELPTEDMRRCFRLACSEFHLPCLGQAPEAEPSAPRVALASNKPDATFETTRWSLVLQAGAQNPPQAQTALNRLCETYWYPLYVFARRQGKNPRDAHDLVQDFFALVLQRDYFLDAERAQGKFRSFLLMAFQRFLANSWERTLGPKRDETEEFLLIDQENTEARYTATRGGELPPERAYQREYAMTLLGQVMERLEAEFSSGGNASALQELRGFLSGDGTAAAYAEAGRKLGLGVEGVKAMVHQLRKRYRELLRAEIADTVTDARGVEDEIRNLSVTLG